MATTITVTTVADSGTATITDFCEYYEEIKYMLGDDLLAYWMMAEDSGPTGIDSSGNGRDGTYSNVTLGQSGIGDGKTAASFNGTSSNLDVYSAGLSSVFPGDEGSFIIWSKMSSAVWADSTRRVFWHFIDSTSTYTYWFRKESAGDINGFWLSKKDRNKKRC